MSHNLVCCCLSSIQCALVSRTDEKNVASFPSVQQLLLSPFASSCGGLKTERTTTGEVSSSLNSLLYFIESSPLSHQPTDAESEMLQQSPTSSGRCQLCSALKTLCEPLLSWLEINSAICWPLVHITAAWCVKTRPLLFIQLRSKQWFVQIFATLITKHRLLYKTKSFIYTITF